MSIYCVWKPLCPFRAFLCQVFLWALLHSSYRRSCTLPHMPGNTCTQKNIYMPEKCRITCQNKPGSFSSFQAFSMPQLLQTLLLRCHRIIKSVCLYISYLPLFRLTKEIVANTTSIKIANCFSSTNETTRIAAAHITDWEIINFLFILNGHLYLLDSHWVFSNRE